MKLCLIAFSALLVFLSGCQNTNPGPTTVSSKDTSFTITGRIKGLDSGMVYLLNYEAGNGSQDSSKIVKGIFTFTGKADTPRYCLLGIPNNGQTEYRSGFFAENTGITIAGHIDSTGALRISGGPVQEEFNAFQAERKKIDEEGNRLSALYDGFQSKLDRKGMDSVMKLFEGLSNQQKEMVKTYAKSHPSSYVAAHEIYQNFAYNP